jgi:DMSO reductase anchor subunit
MHPAPSVIVFTVLSGLGLGFLAYLGAGVIQPTGLNAFLIYAVAYGFAVIGLMASAFHLGNPQRALKAFTQWRTSWLSREAWSSIAALLIMAPAALLAIFTGFPSATFGFPGALLALVAIFCTSMIYAQLKTVPRWNHWTTPALFLAFALTGGAILSGWSAAAVALCLLLGVLLIASYALGDTRFTGRGTTMETATGLGRFGKVRLYEPPHTGTNYLMREMIHVVGRKHSARLRLISVVFAAVLPALVLLALPMSLATIVLALAFHLIGAFAARWLFFAEAEHVVGLYYGAR